MPAQLAPGTQDKVRRRLALKLEPPFSPSARLQRDLSFAAELLRPIPPRLGWSFAYAPRNRYDRQRPPDAPSSASLVARYGSWVEVCRRAYGLVGERSRRGLHFAPRQARGNCNAQEYSQEDAAAGLRACARELNRPPSRHAYTHWRAATERGRRGTHGRPCSSVIVRLYSERGGWLAALEDAGLVEPPAMTVRVVVASEQQAAELLALARAHGLIAAHSSNRRSLEVRGTVGQVRREIVDCARTLAIADLTLWEPRTRTLQHVDLSVRPGPRRFFAPVSDALSTIERIPGTGHRARHA
jgi:hypothetical protein